MVLHKLIARHLKHRDDPEFYLLQASDAIGWIAKARGPFQPGMKVLDLGCGHGVFGAELVKHGCQVTFADEENYLLPEISKCPFKQINIDRDDLGSLGRYDLVICSNVYEHLSKPTQFLEAAHQLLEPAGALYLSWTNWLSPWGGHDFSPLHYLGANLGQRIYDRFAKGKRKHFVNQNLFPTYIGSTLRLISKNPNLRILKAAPRYYTEFSAIIRIPVVREFLAWNCALLIGRKK